MRYVQLCGVIRKSLGKRKSCRMVQSYTTHIKHMNKPTVRAPDIRIVSRCVGFRAYPERLCAYSVQTCSPAALFMTKANGLCSPPVHSHSGQSILQTSKSSPTSTAHHPIFANFKRFTAKSEFRLRVVLVLKGSVGWFNAPLHIWPS